MFNPSLCRMDSSDIINKRRDNTVYYNIQAQVVPPQVKPISFISYEIKQEYTNGKINTGSCSTISG